MRSAVALALGGLATIAVADVEQVHLSLWNKETRITVTWLTTTGNANWDVTFSDKFDFKSSNVVKVQPIIPGASYTYENVNASDGTCFVYNSPTIVTAEVDYSLDDKFLKPTATVYYKITSDQGDSSPVYSFHVPPIPVEGKETPTRLALIGDLGQTENSTRTMQHVLAGTGDGTPYDVAIIVGDLSYADAENLGHCGHPGGCVPMRWDTFGQLIQQVGANTPIMTTPGNHEIELTSVGDRALAARAGCNVTSVPFLEYRFRWFFYQTETPQDLHYSWNVGNVHNIMLNSYSRYVDDAWNTTNAVQYNWLVSDLKNIDRKLTPWILVHLHAPWYNSNSHHRGEVEETDIMALFEPLLVEAKVDVIFAGHVHAYERTHQVLNGKLATKPSYIEINIGDGGNREGPALPWCEPVSLFPWSAYRDAEFGHGTFETANSTHARWTWHRNNVSETDLPGDDIWIVKSDQGPRVYDAIEADEGVVQAGDEWVPGRQKDHVDNPLYGRRQTYRTADPCPSQTW